MTEMVQTDIWVRAMKLAGHDCLYVCADDTHGTPIMLKAAAEGITPEALIQRVGAERRSDFAAFNIDFDNYYTTHSEENRRLTVQDVPRARGRRPHHAPECPAGLRREGRHVPAGPLREGNLPALRDARPVR